MPTRPHTLRRDAASRFARAGAVLALVLLASVTARATGEPESGAELAALLAQQVSGGSRLAAASKYEQDAVEAPSLVYVRTGGEIRAQGYRTLAEVLESLPGIHLRQDRIYSYTGVRGINRPGDYSSRLLLLLDGVRLNDAIYDSATAGNEFPVDVELIDRVEFIPGPGSALYGSNAVLGVVNVVTRSPSQRPGTSLGLDLGALGRRKLSATWGGDIGEARVLLGLSTLRGRGHGSLYYPEYDNPASNNGLAVGQDGERSDKLFAKARWGELGLVAVLSERRKLDPTGGYGVIFNTRSESVDRFATADLSWARRLDAERELYARVGVTAFTYSAFAIYGDASESVAVQTQNEARWFSGEVRYVWSGWAGHRVLFGSEFQHNFHQKLFSADLAPASEIYADSQFDSSRFSLFANDEWEIHRTVRLNLGLRLDRQLDGEIRTTPRIAALWSPAPQWTLKLQSGRAFREANAVEQDFRDTTQVAAGTLKAESLRSLEFAALWRPNAQFDTSLSIYRFELQDIIDFISLPGGEQTYANSGRARTQGVEAEATWQFNDRLRLRGSLARQHAVDADTGAPLSDAPRSVAKLMLTASGPWAGSTAGLNLVRLGERRTPAGRSLPSYLRLNAQFAHAPAGEPWSIAAGLYNLTDARYADPAGPEHLQDSLPQDGRQWRLQLGLRF